MRYKPNSYDVLLSYKTKLQIDKKERDYSRSFFLKQPQPKLKSLVYSKAEGTGLSVLSPNAIPWNPEAV